MNKPVFADVFAVAETAEGRSLESRPIASRRRGRFPQSFKAR